MVEADMRRVVMPALVAVPPDTRARPAMDGLMAATEAPADAPATALATATGMGTTTAIMDALATVVITLGLPLWAVRQAASWVASGPTEVRPSAGSPG